MKNKINNQSGFVLIEEIIKLIIFGVIGFGIFSITKSQIVFWIFVILGILFILAILWDLTNEIIKENKYYASIIEKVKWNKTTSEFIGIDTGYKYSEKKAQEKNKLWNDLPSKEKKKRKREKKREKESHKKWLIAQNKRNKRSEKRNKRLEKAQKKREKEESQKELYYNSKTGSFEKGSKRKHKK